jgi:hypothetical protein
VRGEDAQARIVIAGLLEPLEGDLTALQMRELYDAFDVETVGRQVER